MHKTSTISGSKAGARALLAAYALVSLLNLQPASAGEFCDEALRIGDACDRMRVPCGDLKRAAEEACPPFSFLPASGDCELFRWGVKTCETRIGDCEAKRDQALDSCDVQLSEQSGA